MTLAYHYVIICVRYESYVDNVGPVLYTVLLCWIWKIKAAQSPEMVPCDAVVGYAEVKLALLILKHDDDAYSCDSRFGMMSNISQFF